MSKYSRQKWAILVFLITFLVYSPLLFNQFVGDDITFLEGNTFYRSWENIPRLVEKDYISNPQKMNFNADLLSDPGSGSFSYRPITNLTYFADYYLFRGNPLGSHLINNLIHCINSVLVYWIVDQIFFSSMLAIFAGLLFSLHPIQSEAVANVSCRFDLLAAMFILCSFCFWVKFKEGGYVRKKYYAGSLVMYFLALFSKESALMLPFVIPLFDQLLPSRQSLRQRVIYYIGFIPILIFYLYLYLVVFPNSSISFHWLGGSFINHCLVIGYIWYSYLVNIVFPWTVKVIPGLYCPPVPGLVSLITGEMGIVFIILITSILVLWRHYKEAAFFLLWYVFFYIPVSNLVPIANPMACRFMYLPSIGLLIVLAFFLHKAFKGAFLKGCHQYLSSILLGSVLMVCVVRTLSLNNDWKNDFTVQSAWVRDYPSYGRGYALLGMGYFGEGLFEKAKMYLEKSVLLGDQMPRENLTLAMCYMRLEKFEVAEALLKRIILLYPDYDDAYFCLGASYYEQKNDRQARGILEKALVLNPKKLFGYVLLMKVYSNLHDVEAAKGLLKKADINLNAQKALELQRILEETKAKAYI